MYAASTAAGGYYGGRAMVLLVNEEATAIFVMGATPLPVIKRKSE
jgi:uncharacterized membrane protein (UPF0127 family)